MPDHAINRIIYDFTCNSEQAARNVSNVLMHFISNRFHAIIDEVLSIRVHDSELLKIDKLEIDLGSIAVGDLDVETNGINAVDLEQKFRELLTTMIDKSHGQQVQESHQVSSVLNLKRSYTDAVRYFLLYGDIPWWINKNEAGGITNLLKKAIVQDRENLLHFLNTQAGNWHVLNRVKTNASVTVFTQLKAMLPHINFDDAVLNRSHTGVKEVVLSRTSLDRIKPLLEHRSGRTIVPLKLLMMQRLLINPVPSLQEDIRSLVQLSAQEEVLLRSFFRDQFRLDDAHEKINAILDRLTVYQLEFLWQKTRLIHPSEKSSRLPVVQATEGLKRKAVKVLQLLQHQPLPGTSLLHHQLMTLQEKELNHLYTLIHQLKKQGNTKRHLVEMLTNHPHFSAYKLPLILAEVPLMAEQGRSADAKSNRMFASVVKKMERASSSIRKSLENLPAKEARFIMDTFTFGGYASPQAKNVMRKWLASLPGGNLHMLAAVALLDKEELQKIASRLQTADPDQPLLEQSVIENAGLCLLAPFLPALFKQLGYTEKNQFISPIKAHRALFLLQYMVNKRQKIDEYTLQLNKLLCGLKIDEIIKGFRKLTIRERKEADDLVASAIEHWKVLRSTSLEGFRRSFLQRKGILTQKENFWLLQVEKNAYDLLLDNIPWTFHIIKLPWMPKMIQVEW